MVSGFWARYHRWMKNVLVSRKGNRTPSKVSALPDEKIAGPDLEISPTSGEISQQAYYIYLNEGSPQGREAQHWLDAETQLSAARKILQARRMVQPTPTL